MSTSTFRLDKPAYKTLVNFMLANPKIRAYEAHEHGVDAIEFPDIYFFAELSEEAEHERVLHDVLHNRGVVSKPMVDDWIAEELEEYSE